MTTECPHNQSAREELLSLLNISRENVPNYDELSELAGQCLEEQFLHGCSTGANACGNAFRQILNQEFRISPAGAAESCDLIANDYVLERLKTKHRVTDPVMIPPEKDRFAALELRRAADMGKGSDNSVHRWWLRHRADQLLGLA